MQVDRVIAGKYRLVAKLSTGGMGSVWQAEHLELRSPAAVKLLDPSFLESPDALTRFKREAQSAASLRSANIVQIFDFGVDAGIPYIVMELLRGQSLAERLAAQSPLSPQETLGILSQVARAVGWAHAAGIIHRDLKPGNIFLSEDAGEKVVKLVDFGIAKPSQWEWNNVPVTLTGAVMGTPQYMSPEQASGRRAVDHRTDVWSFGIVAFECLTGYPAFWGDTLAGLLLAICTDPVPIPSQVSQVPAGFDDWFARCAHRDPDLRFPCIADAVDNLRAICGPNAEASSAVAQLDPQAPPTLQSSSHPSLTRNAGAVGEAGVPTSAPSTLTLASRLVPRRRLSTYALLVGLLVTGAVVASYVRLSSSSATSSAAAAPPLQSIDNANTLAPTNTNRTPAGVQADTSHSIPETAASSANLLEAGQSETVQASSKLAGTLGASTGNVAVHRTKTQPSQHSQTVTTEHLPIPAKPSNVSAVTVEATTPVPSSQTDSVETEFGFNPTRTTRRNR